VLTQMRSLAKYIWVVVALVFVGGFLLYQTSGLMGRTPVTASTAVAKVNGHEIPYRDFQLRVQQEIQNQQSRAGRTLTQDDTRRIENSVYDQMITEELLDEQYRKRGIVVTDDEIREFARYAPPPWITSAPELQTEGKFDPDKYQRFLSTSEAKNSGLLVQLENYYRTEIPKDKLLEQVSSGIYASDAELWRAWRDQHDSAQVSYVTFTPTIDDATKKSISDADVRAYFDNHKDEFAGVGRASLSLVMIPRTTTPADSAAAKAKAQSLRDEIAKGAKFEDVAKRESADTLSGTKGGDLGAVPKTAYVQEFSKAADALKPGEISAPVLSPFGYHIIRLDGRKGDTLSLHHILVSIQPSDSAAARVDRMADTLSRLAAANEDGSKLDAAAKHLGLSVVRLTALEDQPAAYSGQVVPSVSAWAFGGARIGETSDLFDDDRGYYLARLDTLRSGGDANFDAVKEDIRVLLAKRAAIDKVTPDAQKLASAAASSSLEAAAKEAGKKIDQTTLFARGSMVPGLGQYTQAVGAAFALPVGAVSQPVKTDEAAYVLRVDKRVVADSAAWEKQKAAQRDLRLNQLRQARIQMFMADLRKAAKIEDHRKEINSAVRRQQA
jgi:peptidyl-prolyl cis-trans isomerase D